MTNVIPFPRAQTDEKTSIERIQINLGYDFGRWCVEFRRATGKFFHRASFDSKVKAEAELERLLEKPGYELHPVQP